MIVEIDRGVVKPLFANVLAALSFLAVLLVPIAPSPAEARDRLRLPSTFSQDQLEDLVIDLGHAVAYTPIAPAQSLGATGFEIGPQVTAVRIDHRADFWRGTLENKPSKYLVFPKLHLQKGLPVGLDVGLQYARAIGQEIGFIGGEVKWAVWRGSSVSPAVALSANYSRMLGVNDLVLEHWGAAVSVSRSLAWATPYVSAGPSWLRGREHDAALTLDPVHELSYRGLVGVKLWFVRFSVAAEAAISPAPSASLRLNFSL